MLKKLKEEVISFSSNNNTHSDYFEVDLSESEKVKDKNTEKYLKEIKENDKKSMVAGAIVTILLIFTILISFNVGRYAVDIKNVVRILFKDIFHFEKTWEDVYETIVWNVRMPRIIAALLVGSSLSVAGATYQGLFKNPMVSPDILGASAGASVGACFMMLLNQNGVIIQLAAFAFGLFAVTLTYSLSKAISKSADMVLMLVLCGLIVSTLFQAFVSIIKYVADTESQLPEITYWLMGSIAKVTYTDIKFFLIPFTLGVIPIMLIRWQLNVMSFGEDEAKAMGVNTRVIRLLCIVCSTLLTAGVVSIAGTVGWVGLMIPHLVRFIVGPNNGRLLPMSFLTGALFMLIVDNVCRSALAYEIPLGVLTSLLGAPFFILILYKHRGN